MNPFNHFRRPLASELKDLINPLHFYEREGHQLSHRSKRPWVLAGLCAFHNDSTAGSFSIRRDSGAFKCFSCGAGGGDVIAYVRKKYGLTFVEAMRYLQEQYGGVR